jgi:hypothetical protein
MASLKIAKIHGVTRVGIIKIPERRNSFVFSDYKIIYYVLCDEFIFPL